MEIALDDLNGVPVKLGPSVTSVVLHFRHRNGDDDVSKKNRSYRTSSHGLLHDLTEQWRWYRIQTYE